MFHTLCSSEATDGHQLKLNWAASSNHRFLGIQGSKTLPESLFLFFDILVQNMNINKNVDTINRRKYVLSSCIPRSRPSSFLLSRAVFRATFLSTTSPPIGTQLSGVPRDTIWASRKFRKPSSKSMRNAMHHLLMTLCWQKQWLSDRNHTTKNTVGTEMLDFRTSNVVLSTGLNILKQSSVDAFSSPYI